MFVGGVIIWVCLGSQFVRVSWVWLHLFLGDNLKADLLVSGSEVSSSSCVLGIFLGFRHLTVSCSYVLNNWSFLWWSLTAAKRSFFKGWELHLSGRGTSHPLPYLELAKPVGVEMSVGKQKDGGGKDGFHFFFFKPTGSQCCQIRCSYNSWVTHLLSMRSVLDFGILFCILFLGFAFGIFSYTWVILVIGLKSKHKIHLCFVYILYIQPKGNLLHSILQLAFDCNLFLEIRCGTFHLWYGDFDFQIVHLLFKNDW